MSDDLEDRKEEVWSMDEVRSAAVETGSGEDVSRTEEGTDSSDTPDGDGTEDTAAISGTQDTTDRSDTEDREDKSDIGTTSDLEDTTDTADAKDTQDTGDIATTQDTAELSDTATATDITDTSDIAGANGPRRDAAGKATGETVRRMALNADEKDLAVRDLHNVNVYLYEDIYREMMATFKELDSEYFREHGDDLSKNKDFFNAVFRAGLDSPRLREELELD